MAILSMHQGKYPRMYPVMNTLLYPTVAKTNDGDELLNKRYRLGVNS